MTRKWQHGFELEAICRFTVDPDQIDHQFVEVKSGILSSIWVISLKDARSSLAFSQLAEPLTYAEVRRDPVNLILNGRTVTVPRWRMECSDQVPSHPDCQIVFIQTEDKP